MTYFSTEPAPALQAFVERYVLVDQQFPKGQQQSIFVAPSSTSQLAINLATANLKPDNSGVLDRHYEVAIVGPFTHRHDYVLHGHVHSVVAYFTPVGLYALLAIDLTDLADETIDFATLCPDDTRHLANQVRTAPDNLAKVQALEQYLLNQLTRERPLHPDVQRASNIIRQQGGRLALQELLAELTLRQRSFERHFRRTTGLTPKQFMRITRFLTVRNAIANKTKPIVTGTTCYIREGIMTKRILFENFRYLQDRRPRLISPVIWVSTTSSS